MGKPQSKQSKQVQEMIEVDNALRNRDSRNIYLYEDAYSTIARNARIELEADEAMWRDDNRRGRR